MAYLFTEVCTVCGAHYKVHPQSGNSDHMCGDCLLVQYPACDSPSNDQKAMRRKKRKAYFSSLKVYEYRKRIVK